MVRFFYSVSTLLEILVPEEQAEQFRQAIRVSTLLEILDTDGDETASSGIEVFQPFLRFWILFHHAAPRRTPLLVSTLLEILVSGIRNSENGFHLQVVSTLLEILVYMRRSSMAIWIARVSTLLEILVSSQAHLTRVSTYIVSTLLEILGLVCLVVVGF